MYANNAIIEISHLLFFKFPLGILTKLMCRNRNRIFYYLWESAGTKFEQRLVLIWPRSRAYQELTEMTERKKYIMLMILYNNISWMFCYFLINIINSPDISLLLTHFVHTLITEACVQNSSIWPPDVHWSKWIFSTPAQDR